MKWNNNENPDWKELSIALFSEIKKMYAKLVHFTISPEENSSEKLYEIKELVDSILIKGLFSDVSITSDKTPIEVSLIALLENLNKRFIKEAG